MRCEELDPAFIGSANSWKEGPDLAIVTISASEKIHLPPMPLARLDRDSSSGDELDRCHAWGYPEFAEVLPHGKGRPAIRESRDAAGSIPVGSGLVSGLLDLQVSLAPRDLPPYNESLGDSPWAGISGGPVIVGGYLIGVVNEQAPRSGSGSLTVTPLTAIDIDPEHSGWGPGLDNSNSWWARLGVAGADFLTVLPRRAQAPYLATVRAMGRSWRSRMARLEGREKELAAIATFATSDRGYRWLVGDAFTGKSALIYFAASAALPDIVDVVIYFLRRTASDSDSSGFLGAVIPQLAALSGSAPPTNFDTHSYRALWEAAVSRTAESGRHLLLLVDGLDEDLHPPGAPSVASLLPDLVAGADSSAAHVHVHVTSRPSPILPTDVAGMPGHPLTNTAPERLTGFPGWEELRDLGLAEIDELVEHGRLARHVFGFLTAARGPLALADIASLVARVHAGEVVDEWDIEQLLVRRAARSIQSTGPAAIKRYQFAHATLLEHAQAHSALNRSEYRERLHAWAETWQLAGWPCIPNDERQIPRYLLDAYPSTLGDDPERLTFLVADVGWIETAIRAIGVVPVLGVLRNASTTNNSDVMAVNALVISQARNLQDPIGLEERGYVMRQLALEAAKYGFEGLAEDIRARMQALPEPRLVPLWASRSRPPAFQLGHHDGGVTAVAVTPSGQVISGGRDGRVLAWDRERPGEPIEVGHHRVECVRCLDTERTRRQWRWR
jgi:hypothetical protein